MKALSWVRLDLAMSCLPRYQPVCYRALEDLTCSFYCQGERFYSYKYVSQRTQHYKKSTAVRYRQYNSSIEVVPLYVDDVQSSTLYMIRTTITMQVLFVVLKQPQLSFMHMIHIFLVRQQSVCIVRIGTRGHRYILPGMPVYSYLSLERHIYVSYVPARSSTNEREISQAQLVSYKLRECYLLVFQCGMECDGTI